MPHTIKETEVQIPRVCTNCQRFGHNKRTCIFPEITPIDKLGVEIEGMWKTQSSMDTAIATARRVTGSAGYRDGSVGYMDGSHRDARTYHSWEFQTRPGDVGSTLTQVKELFPEYVNVTCGMHVHMSFRDPLSATLLTSQKFFSFFENALVTFGALMAFPASHPYWERIEGRNQYCRKNTIDPVERQWFAHNDRYRQVNFTSWGEHRTVEFRVLPLFHSLNQSLEAIKFLFKSVDRFLRLETQEMIDNLIPKTLNLWSEDNQELVISGEVNHKHEQSAFIGVDNLDIPTVPQSSPDSVVVPAWRAAEVAYDFATRMASTAYQRQRRATAALRNAS